jgi:hypothetical protein
MNIAGGFAFEVLTLASTFKFKLKPMKTRIVLFILMVMMLSSCLRALTPDQAANGSYKKCHPMR